MLKKFLIVAVLATFFMIPDQAARAVTLKLATIAPEGSTWMKEMRKGAKEIKERTDGRVAIKFFGGGVMGNEKSVLRKIRIGQLHGGAFTAGGLSGTYPDLRLYGLPMVFHSFEEVDYVRSRMDQVLMDGLEKAGFVSFGFGEGGFALLMSNIPIRSLKDLKGKKVWIPRDDMVSEVGMKFLGLSPITLPITDVLTGLQTGLLDIVATSPIGAIAFQWHVKVKYLTETPLAYLYAMLAVDKRAFSRLSPADQAVMHDVMVEIYDNFNQQSRKDNQAAFEALVKHGLAPVNPSPEEVALWREQADAVNLKLKADKAFNADLYQEMKGHLVDFRSRNSGRVAGQ